MTTTTTTDFEINGIRYNADPMGMTTPSGRPIFFVRKYGKRGGLLAQHRPAYLNVDGEFVLTGSWSR